MSRISQVLDCPVLISKIWPQNVLKEKNSIELKQILDIDTKNSTAPGGAANLFEV